MRGVFLYLQSSKESWVEEGQSRLMEKINHFLPFEIKPIKSKNYPRDQFQRKVEEEEAKIFKNIQETDMVILFDEKGAALDDSLAFSKKLVQIIESGRSRVVFIVGGAFGVSPKIKKRANLVISLSNLTMNHFVARLVALEQIYRALTIWRKLPYHNS